MRAGLGGPCPIQYQLRILSKVENLEPYFLYGRHLFHLPPDTPGTRGS
jgi:hypothetical protein